MLTEKLDVLVQHAPRLFSDRSRVQSLLGTLSDWLILHVDTQCAAGSIAAIASTRGKGGRMKLIGNLKKHVGQRGNKFIKSARDGYEACRDGMCYVNRFGRGRLSFLAANENLHSVEPTEDNDGRGVIIGYCTHWVYAAGVWALRAFEATQKPREQFALWLEDCVLVSKIVPDGETESEEDQLTEQGLLPTSSGIRQHATRHLFTSFMGVGAGRRFAEKYVQAMASLSKAAWSKAKKKHIAITRLTVSQAGCLLAEGRVTIAAASLLRIVNMYPLAARIPGNSDHDRMILLVGIHLDKLRAEWRRRRWVALHGVEVTDTPFHGRIFVGDCVEVALPPFFDDAHLGNAPTLDARPPVFVWTRLVVDSVEMTHFSGAAQVRGSSALRIDGAQTLLPPRCVVWRVRQADESLWRLAAATTEDVALENYRFAGLDFMAGTIEPRWTLELLHEQWALLVSWKVPEFLDECQSKHDRVSLLKLPFFRSRFSGFQAISASVTKAKNGVGFRERFTRLVSADPPSTLCASFEALVASCMKRLKTTSRLVPLVTSRGLQSHAAVTEHRCATLKLGKKQGSAGFLRSVGLSPDELQAVDVAVCESTMGALSNFVDTHTGFKWMEPTLQQLLCPHQSLKPVANTTEGDCCEQYRGFQSEAGWRAVRHGGGEYDRLVNGDPDVGLPAIALEQRAYPLLWPTTLRCDDGTVLQLTYDIDKLLRRDATARGFPNYIDALRSTATQWGAKKHTTV